MAPNMQIWLWALLGAKVADVRLSASLTGSNVAVEVIHLLQEVGHKQGLDDVACTCDLMDRRDSDRTGRVDKYGTACCRNHRAP